MITNKEILHVEFQAWDSENKIMLSWNDLLFRHDFIYIISQQRENIILRQFIGKFDSNGEKLYKDDIVQYDSEDGIIPCIIAWDGFGWNLFDIEFNNFGDTTLQDLDCNDGNKLACDILGNIHENPELLDYMGGNGKNE